MTRQQEIIDGLTKQLQEARGLLERWITAFGAHTSQAKAGSLTTVTRQFLRAESLGDQLTEATALLKKGLDYTLMMEDIKEFLKRQEGGDEDGEDSWIRSESTSPDVADPRSEEPLIRVPLGEPIRFEFFEDDRKIPGELQLHLTTPKVVWPDTPGPSDQAGDVDP